MKITIETNSLQRALFRVQGIAEKKSTTPVLSHVLLQAMAENILTASATDQDVGLSGTYPAEVEEPGAVAVNARQLYDIARSLACEKVQIERQENNWIQVIAGSGRFSLVGIAAEEFPPLPNHSGTPTFEIASANLTRMIEHTLFCTSTDESRHHLSGVYCESPETGMLRMVATDGHRLALSEERFDFEIPLQPGVIVPRKGFQELKRVLSDSSEKIPTVQLGFSGTNGLIKAGTVTLSSRLVEGDFPDYTQVIPKHQDKVAHINTKLFSEALRRVSILSQARAFAVRLAFSAGALELVAEDPELGSANERLEVDYTGENVQIGFNARYLLDVLALAADETVVFSFSDDLSPAIFRPQQQEGFLAVVMPMRI